MDKYLNPISLAHWIHGNGYFTLDNVLIYASIYKEDGLYLIEILERKFGIKATLGENLEKDSGIMIKINMSSITELMTKNSEFSKTWSDICMYHYFK